MRFRHKSFCLHVILLLAGVGLTFAAEIGQEGRAGFRASESLEYDIRWGMLSVGKAVIVSMEYESGGTNILIRGIQARSHGWVSLVKRIDNYIQCVEERVDGQKIRYLVSKKIHEGKFKQDDELDINVAAGTAIWTDNLKGTMVSYFIPEGVQDYVSMVFNLRSSGGEADDEPQEYSLIMDDGVHEMEVTTVATGVVKTAFGPVEASRLAVKSKSSGLFVRNVPGAIWINPETSIILSMEASTKLGNIRTVLEKWEINGENASGALTNRMK